MGKAKVKPVEIRKYVDAMIKGLEKVQDDATAFDDGNGAAGARVRAMLLKVRNVCQDTRKTVSEVKNSR
jgi:hypothetical protein